MPPAARVRRLTGRALSSRGADAAHSGRFAAQRAEYDAAFLAGAAVGKGRPCGVRRTAGWTNWSPARRLWGRRFLAARFPRVFVTRTANRSSSTRRCSPMRFPRGSIPIAAGAAGPWRDPAHRRRRIGHLSPPARPRRGARASGRQLPSLSPRAEGVASRRAGAVRPCDPSGLPFDAVSGGVPSRRVAGGGFRAWRPTRRTCRPEIAATAEAALREAGFSVVRNAPYAGGFATRFYGRPERERRRCRSRSTRALYMDEARREKRAGMARVKRAFSSVIGAVGALCAPARAAE